MPYFGPEYEELIISGKFKVASLWNVANPDVSLKVLHTHRKIRDAVQLGQGLAASGMGLYTILHFRSNKLS